MGDCDVAMGTWPPPSTQVPSMSPTPVSSKVGFSNLERVEKLPALLDAGANWNIIGYVRKQGDWQPFCKMIKSVYMMVLDWKNP